MDANAATVVYTDVDIALGRLQLQGTLGRPARAQSLVLFAHGSGSGRLSPRNRFVAEVLHEAGFATLLFDLLTAREEEEERYTRHLRFDIGLLAQRLLAVTHWLRAQADFGAWPLGYFGASTGAAAALVAAAEAAAQGFDIAAVVSRGGRPDLAGEALTRVHAPTLLIVGGDDTLVIDLNRQALAQLPCVKALELVPHASHLFEEPGTLAAAAQLAAAWFSRYLPGTGAAA
jgi:dienelactone hydrolase